MKKEPPKQLKNPFSENFEKTWELWKEYKKEAFGFEYKSVITEQMGLKHLVDLSDGEEEKAVKIVEQSIRRQWQGFFPLKETTHGTKQSGTKNGKSSVGFREEVKQRFNSRYGNREQAGDEPHLKAV